MPAPPASRVKIVYRPIPLAKIPRRKREGQSDLSLRLKKLMEGGGLNTADLAEWYERPYATMRYWVSGKHIPSDIYMREVLLRTRLLEKIVELAIGRDDSVVPYILRRGPERFEFLKRLYHEARTGRFPKSRSAK